MMMITKGTDLATFATTRTLGEYPSRLVLPCSALALNPNTFLHASPSLKLYNHLELGSSRLFLSSLLVRYPTGPGRTPPQHPCCCMQKRWCNKTRPQPHLFLSSQEKCPVLLHMPLLQSFKMKEVVPCISLLRFYCFVAPLVIEFKYVAIL